MRALAKVSYVVGFLVAVALSASAADARSVNTPRFGDAYDTISPGDSSIPFDADGPAYTAGQRGHNDSRDFQLQGR
jgi:hypothetical protein